MFDSEISLGADFNGELFAEQLQNAIPQQVKQENFLQKDDIGIAAEETFDIVNFASSPKLILIFILDNYSRKCCVNALCRYVHILSNWL